MENNNTQQDNPQTLIQQQPIGNPESIAETKTNQEQDKDFIEQDDYLLSKMQQLAIDVQNELHEAVFDHRVSWIKEMKDYGNLCFRNKQLMEALYAYIKAICALDFGKYHPVTKAQRTEIDFQLKIPVLNNLTQCFITIANQIYLSNGPYYYLNKQNNEQKQIQDYFDPHRAHRSLQRSLELVEQVLKLDVKNEKALFRKANLLIELGEAAQADKMVSLLKEIAFQSQRGQDAYEELKGIEKKIQNPPEGVLNRKRVVEVLQKKEEKQSKEKDWYYLQKQEKIRQERLEQAYIQSLNPITRFIYKNIYQQCCQSKNRHKVNIDFLKQKIA